jgi:hypothetical protein
MKLKRILVLPVILLALAATSACENYGGSSKTDSMPAASAVPVTQFFIVEEDGRLYKFDDAATFRSFQDVGETTFRLTRIGAGPKGETVVYGLPKEQKKLGAEASVVKIDEGRQVVEGAFYGELHRDGRIYVFDRFEDIQPVLELGEPGLRYAMIGAGPNGETVVIVLRSDNKKQKPDALIEAFNSFNGIKS